MRTGKFRSGREPPSSGLTWRRAGFRGRIPAPRTERDADRQDQGALGANQAADKPADQSDQADHAMTALYQANYRPLVRLAALLVADLATAEDIVQESFCAMHERWRALPGTRADDALIYLRWSVVHRSRWTPRRDAAAGGMQAPGRPCGGFGDGFLPLGSAVVSALQALPVPQREVMVLRYFSELSEAEIASATGMSTAAVRSHTAQALSSLRAGLHQAGD